MMDFHNLLDSSKYISSICREDRRRCQSAPHQYCQSMLPDSLHISNTSHCVQVLDISNVHSERPHFWNWVLRVKSTFNTQTPSPHTVSGKIRNTLVEIHIWFVTKWGVVTTPIQKMLIPVKNWPITISKRVNVRYRIFRQIRHCRKAAVPHFQCWGVVNYM